MLSRRCRIQARPNLKLGSGAVKRPKEASASVETPGASGVTAAAAVVVPSSPVLSTTPSTKSNVHDPGDGVIMAQSSAAGHGPNAHNVGNRSAVADVSPIHPIENISVEKQMQVSSTRFPETKALHLDTRLANNDGFDIERDRTDGRHISISSDHRRLSSPLKSPELPSKNRRKFTGEEPLDPKKMTMLDLISWNPKNETVMKYHNGRRSRRCSVAASTSGVPAVESPVSRTESTASSLPAPKVRIAEDGTLVLDETSLTVAQDKSANIWETVDEDRVVRKISSMSFRKSALRKGTPWSEMETELFYVILRATGPDFGLMHEFFPSRSRSELKSKFNREERTNWDRLKHSMSTPTLLHDSLYDQANELLEKIKEETARKKEEQQMKKGKKSMDTVSIDWNEDEADLVAEAEEEILRMQEADEGDEDGVPRKRQRKMTRHAARKMKDKIMEETSKEAKKMVLERRRRKYDAEAKKLYRPAIEGLTPDFPRFRLIYASNVTVASIELDADRMPIVKIPKDTVVTVLSSDDSEPERVLFECQAKEDVPARKYVIKHQAGPGEPSSGFLHLFGTVS